METHNLTSISPGLLGEAHRVLDPYVKGRDATCLVDIKTINTYLQLFTKESWACFYGMLHHTGGRGWCYDACFLHVCGGRLAVDYTQVAYHLEYAVDKIPAAAMEGTNLTFEVPTNYNNPDFYVRNPEGGTTCRRLSCPDLKVLRQHVSKIECGSTRN